MTTDYTEHLEGPTQEQFAKLNALAQELNIAELRVVQAEADLKRAKAGVVEIAEVQLVELMEEMGLEDFTTSSGLKAKLKTSIFASIPVAKQVEALKWLDDNGHAGLIKTQVVAKFTRGEAERARSVAEDLVAQGIIAAAKEGVHPQTLGAWVREQLEGGENIPLDLFGVHRRRSVKVST